MAYRNTRKNDIHTFFVGVRLGSIALLFSTLLSKHFRLWEKARWGPNLGTATALSHNLQTRAVPKVT